MTDLDPDELVDALGASHVERYDSHDAAVRAGKIRLGSTPHPMTELDLEGIAKKLRLKIRPSFMEDVDRLCAEVRRLRDLIVRLDWENIHTHYGFTTSCADCALFASLAHHYTEGGA